MNAATRVWTVRPARMWSGSIELPGDKSVTHRAILLGLLADGETEIVGANAGEDCSASLAAAGALGAAVKRAGGTIRILGTRGRLREPAAELDCGNSGTSLRLLAGIVAGAPVHCVLTGDASLLRRPVERVILPLRAMGATLSARDADRFPPLVVDGGALRGVRFEVPTGSAQVASCILLAGLAASGTTSVRTRAGVRDHTIHALRQFGVTAEARPEADGGTTVEVRGPVLLRAAKVRVPGDPSAAAFFLGLAAATPGLRVEARGINLSPTRLGFLDVLRRMGAQVETIERGEASGEPAGDVIVEGPARLLAADISAGLLPAMVDEVPAWAMAAAVARGTSRLSGASELRIKESDRLRALAENLRALGIEAVEAPDGIAITGGRPRGGNVRAWGDHRIAMAFATLATQAGGAVTVDDAASVGTSFPEFESTFRSLGGSLEAGAGPAA